VKGLGEGGRGRERGDGGERNNAILDATT